MMKRSLRWLAILACSTIAVPLIACSSSSTGDATTSSGPGGGTGAEAEWDALFEATFTSSDLAVDKAKHDMIAGAARPQATKLGDIGHFALLGTTLLGTTKDAFFALDRWSVDHMDEL